MSWTSFKDLADQTISQKGIKHKIQESYVLSLANDLIISFLSPRAKDKISAIYFRSGVLTLAVLDNKFLYQLLSDKDLFIASINAKLDENAVVDLKFLS